MILPLHDPVFSLLVLAIAAKDFCSSVVFLYEMKTTSNFMKSSNLLVAGLLAFDLATALGQATSSPFPVPSVPGAHSPALRENLTRFDLDFSGGTPKDLVAASAIGD
jgi:hypothetical protein